LTLPKYGPLLDPLYHHIITSIDKVKGRDLK
jgi:hypothetical protein